MLPADRANNLVADGHADTVIRVGPSSLVPIAWASHSQASANVNVPTSSPAMAENESRGAAVSPAAEPKATSMEDSFEFSIEIVQHHEISLEEHKVILGSRIMKCLSVLV